MINEYFPNEIRPTPELNCVLLNLPKLAEHIKPMSLVEYNNFYYTEDFKTCVKPACDPEKIKEIILHPNTEVIEEFAFEGCEKIDKLVAECNLRRIYASAFDDIKEIKELIVNSPNYIDVPCDFESKCEIDYANFKSPIYDYYLINYIKFNTKNLEINLSNEHAYEALFAPDEPLPAIESIIVHINERTDKNFVGNFYTNTHLCYYPENNREENVTIPDYITSINSLTFFNNQCMKTLTIGKNVTEIDPLFCADCTNLEYIYIESNVLNVEFENLVSGCLSLKNIYLSKEIYEKYKDKLSSLYKPANSIDDLLLDGKSISEINQIFKHFNDINER